MSTGEKLPDGIFSPHLGGIDPVDFPLVLKSDIHKTIHPHDVHRKIFKQFNCTLEIKQKAMNLNRFNFLNYLQRYNENFAQIAIF